MTKILVTGGTGFLGSAVVKHLLKIKKEVVIFDNNFRGSYSNIKEIKGKIKFVKGDIRNLIDIKKAMKNVTEVYHLAFINGTSNFYDNPKLVMDVGINGTINLLNIINLNKKVKKFVYASSSEIYQEPDKFPTPENIYAKLPNTKNPRYSYASSKILGEVLTYNYLRNDIKKIIFRPHNIYGPSMGFEHVIPQIIRKIIKNTKKLNVKECKIKIQGNGLESRSFCFIEDAAVGIILSANKGKNKEIYNIGNQDEITIRNVILKISKILGIKIKIESGKLQMGSALRRVPDNGKLKKLGYKSIYNLENGLIKTVNWYKNYYLKND